MRMQSLPVTKVSRCPLSRLNADLVSATIAGFVMCYVIWASAATPKKKRKGGNGPGKVLPSEDNGHIMSEDAPPHFPPCGNGMCAPNNVHTQLNSSCKCKDTTKHMASGRSRAANAMHRVQML